MFFKTASCLIISLVCLPLLNAAEIPREDEMIFRLEFAEGEGKIVSDSGPRELDARISGAGILNIIRGIRGNVTWTEGGVRNNALEFDGETYFVESDDRYNRMSALTASFWIWQPEKRETAPHILGNNARLETRHPGFSFFKENPEYGSMVFRVSDGRDEHSVGTDNMPAGQWAHVIGVFSGGKRMDLYINGEKEASSETNIQDTGFETTTFTIGINRAGQKCLPGMKIDEVILWQATLDEAEVKALHEFYSD